MIHAQFMSQNSLTCPISNSYFTSNVLNGVITLILTNEMLNFGKIVGHYAADGFPVWSSSSMAIWLTLNWACHSNTHVHFILFSLKICLFNCRQCLHSTFPEIHTKFEVHSFHSSISLMIKSAHNTHQVSSKVLQILNMSSQLHAILHINSSNMLVICLSLHNSTMTVFQTATAVLKILDSTLYVQPPVPLHYHLPHPTNTVGMKFRLHCHIDVFCMKPMVFIIVKANTNKIYNFMR